MTNSQDFDRLSAYIDNQLSARERADLESRLSREPELQAALGDLRRTVRVLKLLPLVKPPRRFTLTPAMVGARTRREPLFPALRLGAAFCAILLAIVVAGDFAAQGGFGSPAAVGRDAASAQATVTLEVAMPEAELMSATASPDEFMETYAVDGTPTSAVADVANGTEIMSAAAPEATPTPEGTDNRSSATVSPTDKNLDGTAEPESTQIALEMAATATSETAANDAGGSPPPTDAPQPRGLGPLRVFEIVVGILAVLLGLGAWFTRRSA